MHSNTKKTDFLCYRSQNWSLIRISEEIGVSRSTLVQWNSEFEYTLRVLRAVEADDLQSKLVTARQEDLARIVQRQSAIEKELATRKLDDIPTEKLLRLASLTRVEVNQARAETKKLAGKEPYIPDGVPLWRKILHPQSVQNAAASEPKDPVTHLEKESSSAAPKPTNSGPASQESATEESKTVQKQFRNSSETV